ncbi:MAG TPA: AAA family ATPase [Cellvibrionaceae bacterium]|nr:AAA family ATPase [Cellvibrionaceae bacterium]HMW73891.1 AAA family ATPase [Cellvibrionaceae bacterium]HNG58996.1 AAA family ATPase [Cellvibrionaceae bacterium]
MYLKFFGFKELPFSLTPDTSYFYAYHSHQNALNTLLVALHNSEGFIKIVGEVGTGKTLLGRLLLKKLHTSRFVTAYIPNPHLSPDELKLTLAQEIGVPDCTSVPHFQLLGHISRRLIELAVQKKRVVLVLDEAQTMPRETIESLRLLTNLETEKRKLLQVVMLGQPELDDLLARKDLRQLKQRIVFSETLKPLGFSALCSYIRFRLNAANPTAAHLFNRRALVVLFFASGGVPRLINLLAHKSLWSAFGRNQLRVTWQDVRTAVQDTPEARPVARWLLGGNAAKYWLTYGLAAASGALVQWLGY